MVLETYVEESVMRQAEALAVEAGKKGNEAMGLLIGSVARHEGNTYVIADHFATAHNSESPIMVRFENDAFPDLARQINSAKGIVVGWIHSHPGYGCFLSATDVSTQRKYFNEEFSVAFVIDPYKHDENGKILKRAFKLTNGNTYREAGFAVYRKT